MSHPIYHLHMMVGMTIRMMMVGRDKKNQNNQNNKSSQLHLQINNQYNKSPNKWLSHNPYNSKQLRQDSKRSRTLVTQKLKERTKMFTISSLSLATIKRSRRMPSKLLFKTQLGHLQSGSRNGRRLSS